MSTDLSNHESCNNGSNSSSRKKSAKKRTSDEKKRTNPFNPLTEGLGPVQASLGTDFPEPDIKKIP